MFPASTPCYVFRAPAGCYIFVGRVPAILSDDHAEHFPSFDTKDAAFLYARLRGVEPIDAEPADRS